MFKDSVEVIYKSSIIYITPLPLAPEKKPMRRPYSAYSRTYDSQRQEDRPRPKQAPQFFESEPDSDEKYRGPLVDIIEDQEVDPPPPKKSNKKP